MGKKCSELPLFYVASMVRRHPVLTTVPSKECGHVFSLLQEPRASPSAQSAEFWTSTFGNADFWSARCEAQ
jgi:hypothetical protein